MKQQLTNMRDTLKGMKFADMSDDGRRLGIIGMLNAIISHDGTPKRYKPLDPGTRAPLRKKVKHVDPE